MAVCAFALADPLLTVLRGSWWLGAVLSIVVGLILLLLLGGAAGALHPLGESAMMFLAPVFIHPVALGAAGLLRLGAARGLWSRTTSVALALTLVPAGLMVIVVGPAAAVLLDRLTGSTAGHSQRSGNDGEVVSSTADAVSVRFRGRIESFGLTPETRFEFSGPGSGEQTEPVGPAWLKPGQRVEVVRSVRRGGAIQATLLTVWVERRGCPPDWGSETSGAPLAPPDGARELKGMVWEGWFNVDNPAHHAPERWEFLEGGAFAYTNNAGSRYTDARWRQHGQTVSIEKNNCYAQYEGLIDGGAMNGSFRNAGGANTTWSARPLPALPAASK